MTEKFKNLKERETFERKQFLGSETTITHYKKESDVRECIQEFERKLKAMEEMFFHPEKQEIIRQVIQEVRYNKKQVFGEWK